MSSKHPWEMTRDEWDREVAACGLDWTGSQGVASGSFAGPLRLHRRKRFLRSHLPDEWVHGLQIPATHRRVVAHALAGGWPVPAGVLAEYPDLAPETTECRSDA